MIAEVERSDVSVTWNRLGLDVSTANRGLVEEVDWFAGIGPWRFRRDEYDACFSAFAALPR